MARSARTVSAPGKLILMGEHAAVYGRPALVAAIDRRLWATAAPAAEPGVRVALPPLGLERQRSWDEVRDYADAARTRWEAFAAAPSPEGFRDVRGDDPAHVALVAIGEAARHLGAPPSPGVALTVDTDLPVGSGLGSSAAAAVAIAAALGRLAGAPLDPDALRAVALEVERRQHGLPSGIDPATVVLGGFLWATRGPDGRLDVAPARPRPAALAGFRLYDTGTPVDDTGAVVAAVRERVRTDPAGVDRVLDAMAEDTVRFRTAIEADPPDLDAIVARVRSFESGLEWLGVVPQPVRDVVRAVEAAGGAAKVSGAGSVRGRAAGSLLVVHSEPEWLHGLPALAAYAPLDARLGAGGVREEPGP